MSLFKGKRGVELSLWTIVQLILILVFVFFPLWEFVLSDHYKLFERRFISKDVALLIDTLYAAPGDVYYTYDQDTEGIGFNFSKNRAGAFYEFVDVLTYPISTYNFFEDIAIEFIYAQFRLKESYPDVDGKGLQKYSITPTFIKRSATIEPSLGGMLPSSQESVIAAQSRQKISKVMITYSIQRETKDLLENIAIRLETGMKARVFPTESNPVDLVKRIPNLDGIGVMKDDPNLLIVLELLNDPAQQSKFMIVRSSSKDQKYKAAELMLSQLIYNNIKSNIDGIEPVMALEDSSLLASANISVKVVIGNLADSELKKKLSDDNVKLGIAKSIYGAAEEFNR